MGTFVGASWQGPRIGRAVGSFCCVTCAKLLMNTACRRVVYAERYAHDDAACELWMRLQSYNQRREWLRLTQEGYSR